MSVAGASRPGMAAAPEGWSARSLVPWLIPIAIGLAIWLIPPPVGVTQQAWRLFAIFVATIAGIIAKPLPMGGVAIIGIAMTAFTGVLTIGQALSGFGNSVIWLIVLAFMIARGFIKTGLGARIAYMFVALLGKKTLGLSYGLIASDLVLAPAIPSNTARAGGVVFPILRSIAKAYGSEPDNGTAGKIGAFLTKTAYQGTNITSAMFLTAMAANPLAVELARAQGVNITWTGWAVAAIVPGLLSLIVIPMVLYRLYTPEITHTPEAAQMARDKTREMGGMKRNEWIMLGAFVALLVMWIFGTQLGIHTTTAALMGLVILLVAGVLTWGDVKGGQGAWDTLVWFSALVMMATFLNSLGLIPWFSQTVGGWLSGVDWVVAFLVLALVYYYAHYFFASNTAHVSAMYAAFLGISIAAGAPPMLAALVLAFFSSLFSSLTHYATGPAPILFGAGYVPVATWWRLGFIVSLVHIVIWLVVGGAWWKVLGLW